MSRHPEHLHVRIPHRRTMSGGSSISSIDDATGNSMMEAPRSSYSESSVESPLTKLSGSSSSPTNSQRSRTPTNSASQHSLPTPTNNADLTQPPPAVVALLKHQGNKEKLIEAIELGTEQLEVLIETANIEMESQSEYIKRSTINRKILSSLKVQVKEQKRRRDRLLLQQESQRDPLLESMKRQSQRQAQDIERMERQLAQKKSLLSLQGARLRELQQELSIATAYSESLWKSGNRVLAAPKTGAEKVSIQSKDEENTGTKGDSTTAKQLWLDTLRGIRPEDKPDQLLQIAASRRGRRAVDILETAKLRWEYYSGQTRTIKADSEAQEAAIKHAAKMAAEAEEYVMKQRRAIAEVRLIQGLDSEYTLPPVCEDDATPPPEVSSASSPTLSPRHSPVPTE